MDRFVSIFYPDKSVIKTDDICFRKESLYSSHCKYGYGGEVELHFFLNWLSCMLEESEWVNWGTYHTNKDKISKNTFRQFRLPQY